MWQRLLTPRRLSYAWIVGGILWMGWLISTLLGPGNVDLAGQVVGADYLQFYTAGYTLRQGESARLYDIEYQNQVQRELVGPRLQDYHAFITPPFLAWLFVPLSTLPYGLSFATWSVAGLLGLWASLRLLGVARPWRALAWSLTWLPVFTAISFGQNSLLSLLVLSLTCWLWLRERRWAAGLACSLLMYKPQLALGVAVLWLLEWRRDLAALLGLALGSGLWAFLSFWLLPAASSAYVEFARTTLPNLPTWFDFPIWHLYTVRGFWRLLLPHYELLADGLWLLLSFLGLLGFVRFWRRYRQQHALLFAGAIGLTLWVTPHAMIYDWVLLLIPALLLWQHRPQMREGWRTLYAWLWLASFVSSQLTHLQLQVLPQGVALQISVPTLLLALYTAWHWLLNQPQDDMLKRGQERGG